MSELDYVHVCEVCDQCGLCKLECAHRVKWTLTTTKVGIKGL